MNEERVNSDKETQKEENQKNTSQLEKRIIVETKNLVLRI